MKDLLEYIVKSLVGKNNFEIEEKSDGNFTTYTVYAEPPVIGILIGKGGRTVKIIRNLIKVRAILEKKGVNVVIAQKDQSAHHDQLS